MDIITPQDFNQIPYNVPDATVEAPDGSLVENSQFAVFIANAVDDVLIKLLGVPLYNAFIDGLAALPDVWDANKADYDLDDEVLYSNHVYKALVNNPVIEVAPPLNVVEWELVADDAWLQLLNGLNPYTYVTKVRQWVGLKSLLVPYVYSQWLKATYDDHTKVGIVRRTAENATIIDPTKRIVRAYNDFVKQVVGYPNGLAYYLYYAQSLGYYSAVYDVDVYPSLSRYLNAHCLFPQPINGFNI